MRCEFKKNNVCDKQSLDTGTLTLGSLSSFYSDPEIEIPFAKALYGNDRFMRTFYKSLSDNGILVMQLGESPELNSPDETFSRFKNRANTISLLENLGFQSIHVYEEVCIALLITVFCFVRLFSIK